MALLELLRLGKTDSELLGNLMRDRIARNRNAPDECPAVVGNHQIGTASADIQQQYTLIIPALPAPLGRVEQRDRSNFHTENLLAGVLDHIGVLGDLIGLHRDEQRFKLLVRLGHLHYRTVFLRFGMFLFPLVAEQLIPPLHLVHRVRNRLARFTFHHLRNRRGVPHERRKFAQPRERRLTGQ